MNKLINFLKFFKNYKNKQNHSDNFVELMHQKFKSYNSKTAITFKDGDNLQSISYIELLELIGNLSSYFKKQGINKGDRIAILSESRPGWAVAFFASMFTGAIVVPLEFKATLPELVYLVLNSAPRIVCTSLNCIDKAIELKSQVSSIEEIFIVNNEKYSGKFLSLYDLKTSLNKLVIDCKPDKTAMIVYTSGTTGMPKGVMLTYGNILSQLKDFDKAFKVSSISKISFFSIFPLDHIFQIAVGLIAILYRGGEITYSTKFCWHEFMEVLHQKRITILIVAPLFLQILKEKIEKEIFKSKILKIFYRISKYIPVNCLLFVFIGRILFFKIHKKMGGKLKGIMCGASPLDIDIEKFFFRIGLPVFQGYGITECSPVVSANSFTSYKTGSVGKPLPSVSLKISDNGEILVRGANIMKGYYNKPDLTANAIDKEGWFRTGDIGKIDNKGYLYIIGRLKNIIELSSGDKVQPEEVEAVLSKSSKIKEVCVIGNPVKSGKRKGTEDIIAVVVPCNEVQKEFEDDISALKKKITEEINNFSQELSNYKRPHKVVIFDKDLPKTRTGKIKKNLILEWYNLFFN